MSNWMIGLKKEEKRKENMGNKEGVAGPSLEREGRPFGVFSWSSRLI